MSKRVQYIDISRAIAMFFVVLGHVAGGNITRICYSFHMPLFFIISGMVLHPNKEYSIRKYGVTIVRRFKKYYVPYFVWGGLYAVLDWRTIQNLLYGSWEKISEIQSVTSLWFLPVLFLSCIIIEGIFLLFNQSKHIDLYLIAVMIASFVIGFTIPHLKPYGWPLGFDICFTAIGFMLFGFYLRKICDHIIENLAMLIICVLLMFVLIFVITYGVYPPNAESMHVNTYTGTARFLVNALPQSLAVILISMLISKVRISFINNCLSFVGINTLGILVTHRRIAVRFVTYITNRGWSLDSIWVASATVIAVMIVSLVLTMIVKSAAPALLGIAENN